MYPALNGQMLAQDYEKVSLFEETPGCSEVAGVSGKSMGSGCFLKALISLSCTGCEHGMEQHPSC